MNLNRTHTLITMYVLLCSTALRLVNLQLQVATCGVGDELFLNGPQDGSTFATHFGLYKQYQL